MLATPVRENGSQPMVGNYENEVHYTREEFMDELAKQSVEGVHCKEMCGSSNGPEAI